MAIILVVLESKKRKLIALLIMLKHFRASLLRFLSFLEGFLTDSIALFESK